MRTSPSRSATTSASTATRCACWRSTDAESRRSDGSAALGEHLVVGLQLGIAVAIGGPILALGVARVATTPEEGHEDREAHRRDLAHTPGDRARRLLIGQRGC